MCPSLQRGTGLPALATPGTRKHISGQLPEATNVFFTNFSCERRSGLTVAAGGTHLQVRAQRPRAEAERQSCQPPARLSASSEVISLQRGYQQRSAPAEPSPVCRRCRRAAGTGQAEGNSCLLDGNGDVMDVVITE